MKLCPAKVQLVLIMTVAALSGCAQNAGFPIGWGSGEFANRTSSESGESAERRKSPAQLQLEVMDFSDRFVAATWAVLEEMLAVESDPARRVAILSWKVRYASAAMEIASGADPRTSLLDMAIFITAGSWALEQYWVDEVFGPEGVRLRPVYADLERRIWRLAGEKLTPGQTDLLRGLIAQWTRENPPSYEISGLRFRNLEGVEAGDFQSPRDARGLLASVRAWLGEVNTSLLFGERILFYLERTPRLLAQQTDLTLAQIADDFPITRLEPDFPALATYLETLPARMLQEFTVPATGDEADLSAVFPDFSTLQATLVESRALVSESTTLVTSGTGLVQSAGDLSRQIQVLLDQLDAMGKSLAESRVFPREGETGLADIAASLASLERTVTTLQSILLTDEEGLTPAGRLLYESGVQVNAAIDRVFVRALWLLGIVFLMGCFWIVLARLLRTRPPDKITAEEGGGPGPTNQS